MRDTGLEEAQAGIKMAEKGLYILRESCMLVYWGMLLKNTSLRK